MYIDDLGTTFTDTTTQTTDDSDELDKNAFLTLLVAQMENQDPLNPMEGTEFTAQLAQYSSLEQLYNVNENLVAINDEQTGSSNYQALDFMGKDILVDGDTWTLLENNTVSGGFSVEETAECDVEIFDEDGLLVKEISMGMVDPGTHTFEWDGLDADGDALSDGSYTFEVTALSDTGDTLSVESYIGGTVDRVSLAGDTPLLYVGETSVEVSEVYDIRLPADN